MTETWTTVPGYPEYEVSNLGRVKSCSRAVRGRYGTRRIAERIMRLTPTKSGHLTVEFQRDGKRQRVLVHRVVLEAFAGHAPEGTEGCHVNGDPSDNQLSNLYWGTRSDNMHDAVRHGTHRWSSRTHCERGHELTPDNTRTRSSGTGRECVQCARIWRERKNEARRQRRHATRRSA